MSELPPLFLTSIAYRTFCPSWNFCPPCSFCTQVVSFTIWCNAPHYTVRIRIRVQPLFSHHFGATLVTLRYIRITSPVMTLRLFSCQTNSGKQRVSESWKLDSTHCVCVCVCAENENLVLTLHWSLKGLINKRGRGENEDSFGCCLNQCSGKASYIG